MQQSFFYAMKVLLKGPIVPTKGPVYALNIMLQTERDVGEGRQPNGKGGNQGLSKLI